MNNNNISPFGWVVILAVALTLLGQLFGGNTTTTTTTSSAPTRDDSFERWYVEQRFKQEGYSAKDSTTAADAVLKFQRAQESRRNR